MFCMQTHFVLWPTRTKTCSNVCTLNQHGQKCTSNTVIYVTAWHWRFAISGVFIWVLHTNVYTYKWTKMLLWLHHITKWYVTVRYSLIILDTWMEIQLASVHLNGSNTEWRQSYNTWYLDQRNGWHKNLDSFSHCWLAEITSGTDHRWSVSLVTGKTTHLLAIHTTT